MTANPPNGQRPSKAFTSDPASPLSALALVLLPTIPQNETKFADNLDGSLAIVCGGMSDMGDRSQKLRYPLSIAGHDKLLNF
jgi:hypothetical protein